MRFPRRRMGSAESENHFARHKRSDACSSGAVCRREMATPSLGPAHIARWPRMSLQTFERETILKQTTEIGKSR